MLAGPPPCPGQGSGVPHYPGGVSDAGGNPSLTCLWNSLRPSCHPPTTERQWTLNKPECTTLQMAVLSFQNL